MLANLGLAWIVASERPCAALAETGRKGARAMATDLSRREFLSGTGKAAAGAAALAVTAALPSGGADAQQRAINVRFGQHDMRGESEVDITLRAAHSSVNGVSLIVRTPNQEVWPAAYTAARSVAEQEGLPVSLVLSADGPNRLDFWSAGQYAGTIENPVANERLERIIRQGLRESYALGFGRDQVSLAPTQE